MQSAVTAVSKLNNSEFDGRLIHVCHRGELEVEHSCVKELKDLVSSGLPSCINSKKSSEVRSLYSVVKPTFPGTFVCMLAMYCILNTASEHVVLCCIGTSEHEFCFTGRNNFQRMNKLHDRVLNTLFLHYTVLPGTTQ